MPTFYICQLGQFNYTTLNTFGYSRYEKLFLGMLERNEGNSEYIAQWTGKFGNQTAEEILKAAFEYDYSDVEIDDR